MVTQNLNICVFCRKFTAAHIAHRIGGDTGDFGRVVSLRRKRNEIDLNRDCRISSKLFHKPMNNRVDLSRVYGNESAPKRSSDIMETQSFARLLPV